MNGPFDPVLKDWLETGPQDWLAWLRLPVAPCEWINANTAVVASEADRVLRVDSEPEPWLLHLELQADHDLHLPLRIQRYFAVLRERHRLQVHSVAILLRRTANASNMTGILSSGAPGAPESVFRYSVIRLWEQPVEQFLTGGIGILPLAPLAAVKKQELPQVIHKIEKRLEEDVTANERVRIWTTTYLLMGLSWEQEFIEHVTRGVRHMKSSVTYQAILNEGREEGRVEGLELGRVEGLEVGREEGSITEARELLLRLGQKKFGRPPTKRQLATLNAITELSRLESLVDRLLDVDSWSALLSQ